MTDASLQKAFTNDASSKSKKNNCYDDWNFLTQNISSDIVVSSQAVPYMNCVNAFRRFEHNFEGLRFFDLKRWGIEWKHYYGNEKDSVELKGNDMRRAVEVPWEAMANGAGSSRVEPVVASGSVVLNLTQKLNILGLLAGEYGGIVFHCLFLGVTRSEEKGNRQCGNFQNTCYFHCLIYFFRLIFLLNTLLSGASS